MKIVESGMPEEKIWNSFFDPSVILSTLGIDKTISDVAEFGCGYGTFTIPAAKMISGKIYAIDLEQSMLGITQEKADLEKCSNVVTVYRDFISNGSSIESESVDYAMIFNIIHGDDREKILKEAYRILKKDGKMGIIHWNCDSKTPRGPPMEIRLSSEQCGILAESNGFEKVSTFDLKPYHYGMICKKI